MVDGLDLVQVFVIGAGTGFGSTLGVELARYLVNRAAKRKFIEVV